MLINIIEIDVKVKCIEESKTQARLAEEFSTTCSYVSRLIKTPEKIINKTFVAMMEALGYDIELSYKWSREELLALSAPNKFHQMAQS